MMMKKFFNWMLMAAVVVGLGTTITACSDDDDDKNEQRNADADPADTEASQAAWRWLCAMADIQVLGDNWDKKTYEPTIGVPSGNNKLNRLVIVTSMDEAKQNFASIADVDVSQLSTSQTFDVKGVGKLTWTPSPAGAQNLAEVTVDTKLIPTLQKIVYCTEDQRDENGIFSDNIEGVAYYRFGDVIKKNGYYWVCVRPCHEVGDKGKSHWINVYNAKEGSDILSSNIYEKYNKKYNNKTIMLPTELKYNREHIYNFGNLLRALLDPDDYQNTVGDNGKGLGGMPMEYHCKQFVENVADYWDHYDIWQKLFGMSKNDIKKLTYTNFYYKGYSWIMGSNATLWCYSQKSYYYSISGSESADKVSVPVKTDGFDIRRYTFSDKADNTVGHKQNDGMNGYWVIRYATGEDLTGSDGKVTPTSGIPMSSEVYRYYKEKDVQAGSNWSDVKKWDTLANGEKDAQEFGKIKVGYLLSSDGKIYATEKEANKDGQIAMGIVAFTQATSAVNRIDESSLKVNLFITLKGAGKCTWGETGSCATRVSVDFTELQKPRDGIKMTKQLSKDGHSHPAAKACYEYYDDLIEASSLKPFDDANFFLPSTGQWVMALEGITGKKWGNMTDGADFVNKVNNWYINAGVSSTGYDCITEYLDSQDTVSFWTSTEATDMKAYVLTINKKTGPVFEARDKSESNRVFPFILYK